MSEPPSDLPHGNGHMFLSSLSHIASSDNLHKARKPLNKFHKSPFHRPSTPPPPTEQVSLPKDAEAIPMSKQHSRFVKITKKASRLATELAGDLAFGSTKDGHVDHRYEEFKSKRLRERESKSQKELDLVRQNLNEKGIEAYLEHLRFFLEYMDHSELDDPIDYAITRRDLWLSWYKKLLISMRDEVQDYEDLVKQRKTLHTHGSSAYQDIKHEADYKFKTKLHDLSSISQPEAVQNLQNSMFNDKRVVLILLWFLQIVKKLLNQPTMFHKEVLEAFGNGPEFVDPSKQEDPNEVCIVTSNKMISSKMESSIKELHSAAENSILSAHVEFLNGWQIRHDNPQLHTNFVSVTGTMRKLIDYAHKGVIPKSLESEYPNFANPVLDDDFYRFQLSNDEKKFVKDYSSFTTVSSDQLPLADSSQSCICCPDFTLAVTDDNFVSTLAEFKRALRPSGYLQLFIWDLESMQKDLKPQSDDENLRRLVWEKIAKFNFDRKCVVSEASSKIVPTLRQLGFRKIRYSYVGHPFISTISESPDLVNMSHSSSSDSGRTESTTSTAHLGYKDLRVNAFFEFFANYVEFLMFSKIVSIFQLMETLKYQAATEETTKLGDEETLNLIKLFIDYKLNGCAGKLVQKHFPDLPAKHDPIRNEGIGYSMVLIAEK
ncbi:hypothetical protein OGAPHI_006684 [Ogataea philodendri]|uniref:Uncharacterized protein n=1 Tax=Ogataea philodendri TaxID=1378263 RepID=A0A9P8NXA3_9ASCO|nr:uncharacterized protein OGAPHI_006684 [Ogataea philodendri]KAH3661277.1 hypothetical protein OGAPHI_006684 [Ogataea philodendri]